MESRSLSSTNLRSRYSISPNDLILPKAYSFLPPCTSASTTPSFTDSPSSPLLSFASVDFELMSLDSQSYTSLKDILPTTSLVNSPTPAGRSSATSYYEIPRHDLIVKKSTWDDMQPVAASPGSSDRHLYFADLFTCGLAPVLTKAFHQFLIQLRICPTQG